MEMTVLVLIVWDYFEDELNLMYVKYLNHACHFNTKGQQFRVRKFKDAHTVSDTGEQPNNFIFSDDAKKIFIKRLLWGQRGGTNNNFRGIIQEWFSLGKESMFLQKCQ